MKKSTKKAPRRADRKSISYRLTDDELKPVRADLERENSGGRPEVKLTAYAKHALILHGSLNRTVSSVIDLRKSVAASESLSVGREWLVEQLTSILGEVRS